MDDQTATMPARAGLRNRSSVLRLISLFALLCIIPLATLTYLTIHLADHAVIEEVNASLSSTSAVAALLAQQGMGHMAGMASSYATRPVVIKALADGNPAHYEIAPLKTQMSQLFASVEGIAGVFVADTDCRVTQVLPATPGIIGGDFSVEDWCHGVHATGRPYVSDAYVSALAGHPLVVAAAAIVRADPSDIASRPLAILTIVYSLEFMKGFGAQLDKAQGMHLTVTDKRGTVLVGKTKGANSPVPGLPSAAADPRIREALAGRSGVTRSVTMNGDSLSAYAPVASIGWTITTEIPASRALAGVHTLDSTVLSVAGVLGLVLFTGLVLLAWNLKQRRKAERALVDREANTGAILEAASDAFVSMDAEGTITAWNRQAQSVFGWTEAEALGRPFPETIIPADRREDRKKMFADFIATGGDDHRFRERFKGVALHRDGHEFPAELAIWPVRTKDTWSFNTFIRDITTEQQAAADLAAARDNALEASRMKSEFLANMSHEIRTPMNGVLGMTSLLLDTDLAVNQREFAETVRVSGEALMDILNDILDFSKIEAGRLDLECIDFDLRGVVEDVASLFRQPAHSKGLELACSLPMDLPVTLRGDPGRLRQIVTNLLGNAVKFTPSGQVVLEMTMADGGAGGGGGGGVGVGAGETAIVRFEISDTGIGIAVADQAAMFESFSQADAGTTRRYGGTGLGLAICRQLVELMGGQIGIRSELGQGSTFWFTVPLQLGHSVAEPAPRASLSGLRILVVDDNATNRAILTRFLQSWDVRSEAVDGADQALMALARSEAIGDPFDAALLDLNMPGIDGIQLARIIATDTTVRPTKMVLLTSSGERGMAGMARDAGISACLTKPVRQFQLHDCLTTIMGVAPAGAGQDALAPVAPVARKVPARQGESGHLLLAEDNQVNQRVAAAMLKNLGFAVDVVADGADAVKAAALTRYDAILMDCQMPVLDGYQATREIRRLQVGTLRVPIVAVTASAMKSDQALCLAAGMDDYLVKPLSLKALAAVLGRWVPSGALQRSADLPVAERAAVDAAEGAADGAAAAAVGPARPAPDVGVMAQMAVVFMVDADAQVVALRHALEDGDAAGVVRSAHTLSGASADVGAIDLARLCTTLEASGTGGDLFGSGEMLEAVEAELGRFSLALSTAAMRAS